MLISFTANQHGQKLIEYGPEGTDFMRELPSTFRQVTFAAIMSMFTVLIVSATITLTHTGFNQVFCILV